MAITTTPRPSAPTTPPPALADQKEALATKPELKGDVAPAAKAKTTDATATTAKTLSPQATAAAAAVQASAVPVGDKFATATAIVDARVEAQAAHGGEPTANAEAAFQSFANLAGALQVKKGDVPTAPAFDLAWAQTLEQDATPTLMQIVSSVSIAQETTETHQNESQQLNSERKADYRAYIAEQTMRALDPSALKEKLAGTPDVFVRPLLENQKLMQVIGQIFANKGGSQSSLRMKDAPDLGPVNLHELEEAIQPSAGAIMGTLVELKSIDPKLLKDAIAAHAKGDKPALLKLDPKVAKALAKLVGLHAGKEGPPKWPSGLIHLLPNFFAKTPGAEANAPPQAGNQAGGPANAGQPTSEGIFDIGSLIANGDIETLMMMVLGKIKQDATSAVREQLGEMQVLNKERSADRKAISFRKQEKARMDTLMGAELKQLKLNGEVLPETTLEQWAQSRLVNVGADGKMSLAPLSYPIDPSFTQAASDGSGDASGGVAGSAPGSTTSGDGGSKVSGGGSIHVPAGKNVKYKGPEHLTDAQAKQIAAQYGIPVEDAQRFYTYYREHVSAEIGGAATRTFSQMGKPDFEHWLSGDFDRSKITSKNPDSATFGPQLKAGEANDSSVDSFIQKLADAGVTATEHRQQQADKVANKAASKEGKAIQKQIDALEVNVGGGKKVDRYPTQSQLNKMSDKELEAFFTAIAKEHPELGIDAKSMQDTINSIIRHQYIPGEFETGKKALQEFYDTMGECDDPSLKSAMYEMLERSQDKATALIHNAFWDPLHAINPPANRALKDLFGFSDDEIFGAISNVNDSLSARRGAGTVDYAGYVPPFTRDSVNAELKEKRTETEGTKKALQDQLDKLPEPSGAPPVQESVLGDIASAWSEARRNQTQDPSSGRMVGEQQQTPPAPAKTETMAQIEADLDAAQSDLDSKGDLSQERELSLQIAMDRMSKITEMLSNTMKKIGDTQSSIIGNMK